MGFSLSWVAVRGKTGRDVCDELGVEGTGRREEFPESPLTGAELPGGWYLVIANHDPRFSLDEVLERISAYSEMVTCFVEEHVMYSAATGWRGGKKVWSIIHESDKGIDHLETEGDLPPMFGSIRDRLRLEQEAAGGKDAEVDFFFSVPVELAGTLTGFRHFRHDEIFPTGHKPFEVLVMRGDIGSGGSLWKVLGDLCEWGKRLSRATGILGGQRPSLQEPLELSQLAERMEAVRASVEEMRAGQGIPAEEVLAEMRQILAEKQRG
jgi:hypothetical protein